MNVLFLTPRPPLSAASGGLQVTRERLQALSRVASVTVVHLGVEADPSVPQRPAADRWRAIEAGRLRARTPRGLAASYARGLPLSVWRNSARAYLEAVRALRGHRWDLLYVDHWLVLEAARPFTSTRTVLHLHNAETELIRRAAQQMTRARRAIAMLEYLRSLRYLRRAVARVDELHLLSAADREVLDRSGVSHPTTHVFLPAVEGAVSDFLPGFRARAPAALFVGSLSWPPNAEGLAWYLERAWPLRRAARRLDVVGAGAPEDLRVLAGKRADVELRGFVDRLEPMYAGARCLIAPLRSGSGIKMKIINALARGLPVVTTPVGVEGLPDAGGDAVIVAERAEGLAAAVDGLVTDEAQWAAASAAARAYVARHFSGAAFAGWCEALPKHPRRSP